MEIEETRRWRCVLCSEVVRETRLAQTHEGEVPDQSNCDLSTYSQSIVSNGRLLAGRPQQYWRPSVSIQDSDPIPEGGLCIHCLSQTDIVKLVPYIRFC